jgi:hypothetical protein
MAHPRERQRGADYNLRSMVGIATLLSCAWLLSEDRRSVWWRKVGLGLGLTVVLVVLLLKVPPVGSTFARVNDAVDAPYPLHRPAYRRRNVIEHLFCHLKNWRRIATRYDRLARNYLAALALVAVTAEWTT